MLIRASAEQLSKYAYIKQKGIFFWGYTNKTILYCWDFYPSNFHIFSFFLLYRFFHFLKFVFLFFFCCNTRKWFIRWFTVSETESSSPIPESTTSDDKQSTATTTTTAYQDKQKQHLEKLTPIELLCLLFEDQEKRVLELALEGFNGQLLQAIEHFVCVRQLSRSRKTESRSNFSMSSLLSQSTTTAPFIPNSLSSTTNSFMSPKSSALDLRQNSISETDTQQSLSPANSSTD